MSTRNAFRLAATATPLARKRAALMVSAAAVALLAMPTAALAQSQGPGAPGPNVLPQDPTVVAGGAGFNTSGSNLNVNQSTDRVVIDWRSFDIGAEAGVNFYQPDSSSIAVNRVSGGGMPSQINGALTANGVVVILNPNGVLFSASSRVDVGGLVASTGQMNIDRFMAGDTRLEFTGATSGAIVTAGQINISGAGLGAFVAPSVRNDGVITARLGRVALAAGETFTLDLAGDRLIELGLGANTPLVENYGSILADGGRVQLSALAAGVVVDQVINAGGHISVSSAHQDGGTIVLEGDTVTVSGALDASGATGGGDIRALADHLTVTGDASLTAAATVAGDGGFIETSGYQTVSIADGVAVNAAGAGGAAGTWLIDPLNLTITTGANNGVVSGSTVTAGTIETALGGGTTVSLTTNQAGAEDGDLTVAGSVNATSTGGASLILTGRHILATGGSTISIAGGDLTMNVNAVNTLADTTGSGNWIQDALDVIGTVSGDVAINLGAGIYRAGAIISDSHVTLDGQNVARIDATHDGDNGINITGDYNTVQNLEIFGAADQNYITYGWPTITRGIFAHNGADNTTITGNNIHDVRTGIIFDGRNANSSATNNLIENTKGAISVQYTDGSNLILTGNREGAFGNEWGINVHLNGILQSNGSITPSGGALGANTSLAEQQRLLDLRDANNGMSVQNQAWSASNRTHAYVSTTGGASNQGSARSTINTVQGGVNAVVNGGTVYVADGTYNWGSSALQIKKSLTLLGQSESGTIFDGRGVGSGLGTLQVQADNVTLSNFTLYGADSGANNYGIKVQPNATGYSVNQRLLNFAISDVTVRGSTRAELDLNGVVGATITNFTADGRRVTDDSHESGGAGIQITDSSDITLSGVHTLGNAWGGVALYQSNKAGAYNGQTTNINIDAGANRFDEALGLFTQLESATQSFGQLNLTGFNYAVRNTGHRSDGNQFTFFRTSLNDATAFALALGAPTTGSIEGYTGTDFSNVFTVVDGLAINSAVRDARNGGTINVEDGTYAGFATAFSGPANLTVQATGSGAVIDGSGGTTAGRIVDLRADGATFSGFTIQSDGTGVGVSVSGQGVTVSGNTIRDVLTGVQTTTQYAAGNAVITGNSISADYGVSLQNTGNTVTDNTVNAAIEGVGLLQGANSFSGNAFTLATDADAMNFYGTASATNLLSSDNTVSIDGGGLQGAVDLAGRQGTVNMGARTYAETVTIRGGLTLSGSGMDNTAITGGIALSNTAFSDLTLQGFTLSGNGGGNSLVRNGRVTNLTVDGVRFNGEGVAGRHGFAGGQFGGDISITNSEFVNIRGWSAFDTSTGGTATAITGVVFSNNLLDNTVGHITFRQATPTADVLISGNTVRNVGDTTDLSSGIFKVFGAATVDFTGNDISGIGASPTRFTMGVADGAALIVRDVNTLNLTDNSFADNRQALLVGAGNALPGVINITGNTFDNNAYDIFLPASTGGTITFGAGNEFISGAATQQHLVRIASGDIDLTNVRFDGQLGSEMTTAELLALEDRIGHATDFAGAGLALIKAGNVFVTTTSGSVQRGIDAAGTGFTVNVADGTYNWGSSALQIKKSLTLLGQSESGTIFDGRGVGSGLGTLQVQADNVTLSNFTLYGADSGTNNYGIKVQPNATGYSVNQRLLNFAISDVTVRGSTRAELDLNGVVGATITNFTADGRRVTDDSHESGGAGIQITDSSDITLTGVHTLGNAWGGVALYQSNKAGAYNGQTTNINIDAGANRFDEALGLFTQLESATQSFGQLNLTGFNYAVRNTGHRSDGNQFTFFRTSLNDATAFALALGAPTTGSIEGYTGTDFSNVFTVVDGLAIGSAVRDARAGAAINVGAGTFNEAVTIDRNLTLTGAGMDDTLITGGIQTSGALTDLRLADFAVEGTANGTAVISNGGSITGLSVDGVRIDGLGVTGRHGFIGGQIGGDISITNSEFLNIRGWAAFDTRSGAGGANDGTQITSAVFSGNILDNTAGHIAFRQQTGSGPYPDITIANNTVTNVGDSTLSFGAIFKAFRAGTVTFTGNTVSDIGISSWTPAGEATYGAALMTRDVGILNVIGNSFTDNNQVFAVEPGRALPTQTNFSGNTFTNNAYAIYLPGDVTGGGTITFGAGNNFVAGANTVRHIVWRSAAGLDLTNVAFNGVLGSAMDSAALFATEDLITHGVDVAGAGLARVVDGQLYVTTGSGTDAARRAVALAASGDTLNLSAGTHTLTNTLFLGTSIKVVGQGAGSTILDASGHSAYGIRVHGDNVSLSDFTLNGSAAASNSTYGIKVEVGSGDANGLNDGFSIRNVAISGSRKTGLDLNTTVGAVIDGVTVTGVTNGNGIAITDSADVVVRNSTTSGNAWGGLALYQTNNLGGGGSTRQLTNVTVEANNAFGEANGAYLQDSSTLQSAGTLNILGHDFVVRNAGHRADGSEFTFFQTSLPAALDFAANLGAADTSIVRGWDTSAIDTNVYVGFGNLAGGGTLGLSLQTAFDLSGSGDTIHVASGDYGQSATLGGVRVLDLGDVTVTSLTLDAGAAGSTLGGNLTASGSGLTFSNGLILSRDTVLAGGDITLGSVSGAHALTVDGDAVAIGSANLASLTASGATIGTAGVTTTGAQSYTGATTLNGAYTGTGFTVAGATTLGGDTTVGGSSISLGSVNGAHSLGLAGTGAVALGTANLASLTASGATIGTAGVTTTGAQSYTGATTLNGAYTGTGFTVAGATTLGGDTTVGGSSISLGSVNGAHSLGLTGTGAVALGTANLASLTASGATIGTAGVTTTGAQSYTGATTLNGAYTGTGFTVAGATTLGGDTTVGGSSISLGSVSGAHSLGLAGTGAVAIGSANLASLTASGATIGTAGVTTTGAQSYTGATTLNGAYTGTGFTVAGATTLGGDTTVGGSSISLGSVSGAHSLGLAGTGAVAIGSANLASLTASGATIGTAGVTTTGAQSYTGATTLNGAYTGTGFTVAGATTLGGDTTVGGSAVALDMVDGAHALTINGGAGTVRLGAVGGTTALTSASVSGGALDINGARTSGAQTYTGATITASGQYTTAGGAYALSGSTTLDGATTVSTQGGTITTGDINGTVAGGQSLGIDAGAGSASLGALGSSIRLGAVLVRANTTVLNGTTYAGNSLAFEGTGANANVRLTRALTTFNSTSGASAGTISISPNLIGTVAGAQSVAFIAGPGTGATGNGDIIVGNLGSNAVRLGSMSVNGRNLTAQTVKLAGNYTSVLAGNQTFSAQTLDLLGNADIRVAGNDTGPIIAGGSVSIVSGGTTNGSLTAAGPVNITSTGDTNRVITSGGTTSIVSQGTIGGSVVSRGPVTLAANGPIVTSVTTPGAVSITSNSTVNVNVDAGSVDLTASGGTVTGTFGTISTDADGTFNVNGEVVVGDGIANDRQILVDSFLAPAGGVVGATGQIQLPVNFALALIAPAGDGSGTARQPILVNSIDRLGELLRLGYTAIIIQIDSGEEYEQELNLAAEDATQPQA